MLTAFGWVVFGMAVWGLCIVMQAAERRFAPELGTMDTGLGRRRKAKETPTATAKDDEIAALKKRIEVLEAIVTDRRYQWDSEYHQTER